MTADNINDKVGSKSAESAASESQGLNLLSAMKDGSGEKKDPRSLEEIQKAFDDMPRQIEAAQKAVEAARQNLADFIKKNGVGDLAHSGAEWLAYHAEKSKS
ncbi:MAG: hypothetical protein K2X77_28460 [Candidatus Obscuribacterales bacterium]|jgi:hypothetical protein|nr:hypothetical protein [Candidatus Obscuribacterales bacterium]